MGEIIQFIAESDLERARLIREARAIYDSIFPPTDAIGEPPGPLNQGTQPGASEPTGFLKAGGRRLRN
jgi:hypothetical protein